MTRKKDERKMKLTVEAFEDYIRINGTPPTIREVMEMVGFNSAAHTLYYIKDAVRRGLLIEKGDRSASRRYTLPNLEVSVPNVLGIMSGLNADQLEVLLRDTVSALLEYYRDRPELAFIWHKRNNISLLSVPQLAKDVVKRARFFENNFEVDTEGVEDVV